MNELRETQEIYSQDLSDMIKLLQAQVDAPIPIPPDVLDRPCRAAYLGSEAVVVMFSTDGGLSTKSLQTFPSSVLVSLVQACAPELQKRLSAKRAAESVKTKAMESVLKELQNAKVGFGRAPATVERPKEEPRRIIAEEDSEWPSA